MIRICSQSSPIKVNTFGLPLALSPVLGFLNDRQVKNHVTRENVPVAVAFAFAFTAASTDGGKAVNAKGMYLAAENFGQGCKQLRANLPAACTKRNGVTCLINEMLLLGSFLIFVFLLATQKVFHLTVQTTQFVDMQDQEHVPQTTAIT